MRTLSISSFSCKVMGQERNNLLWPNSAGTAQTLNNLTVVCAGQFVLEHCLLMMRCLYDGMDLTFLYKWVHPSRVLSLSSLICKAMGQERVTCSGPSPRKGADAVQSHRGLRQAVRAGAIAC